MRRRRIRLTDEQGVAAAAEIRGFGVAEADVDRLRQVGRGFRNRNVGVEQLCGRCARGALAVSPGGEVWPCVFARSMVIGNVHSAVRSAEWHDAFERVPRHVFVPRFTLAHSVTTVDIDPELVELARERLRTAGYDPTVAVADGYGGFPENAPYDRVIGTCYVWPLPTAWIAQTRPGGCVVALVPNGLVPLHVREDGSASGPFHPETFGFMYMRGGHMPLGVSTDEVQALLGGGGTTRSCRLPARITEAGRNWSFWFFWGFFVAPFALDRRSSTVTQGGPRRMWDEIEGLFDTWCRLGAPDREEFCLTVTPDGRQVLWLDAPDSEHRWELKI